MSILFDSTKKRVVVDEKMSRLLRDDVVCCSTRRGERRQHSCVLKVLRPIKDGRKKGEERERTAKWSDLIFRYFVVLNHRLRPAHKVIPYGIN